MQVKRNKIIAIFIFIITLLSLIMRINRAFASEYPFLKNGDFTERGCFYTSCPNSSNERKNNIALAVKAIDKTFIDIDGCFSFNDTVGERSESRGYQNAKIIVGGKFSEGVGGGVCQVSTTLYNAVIVAGLKIIEHHAHSLPVSYVSPSFDAMVSFRWADLRFVNDTGFPVYIRASFDGERITVKIFGKKNEFEIKRKSVVTEKIEIKTQTIFAGYEEEFKDFSVGETVISYGKEGLKSEGYLLYYLNGKLFKTVKLRKDSYSSQDKIVVVKNLPEEISKPS